MSLESPNNLDQKVLDIGMSYIQYRNLLDRLYAEGKTTGENHSEQMLNYAKLNLQRMSRLDKKIELSDALKQQIQSLKIKEDKLLFLVLTEGWCGDAAQNLPLINKISEAHSQIELLLILRDENLEIMDQFLTNGGRSIPKLITVRASDLKVLGTWGPRPEIAQEMVREFKKIPNGDYQEFVKGLQLWYAKDKTMAHQEEMIDLLKEVSTAFD